MKRIVLTPSLEDYVRVIAALSADGEPAHCKDVAKRLGVKMPSVTSALRTLSRHGLIVYHANYPVELTDQGRGVARELRRRHEVMVRYFAEALRFPPEEAEAHACRVEHTMEPEAVRRMVLLLDALFSREDARPVRAYLAEAMALLADGGEYVFCVAGALEPRESAVVKGYGRNLADPARLSEQGLVPGCSFHFGGYDDARAKCLLRIGSREVWLDRRDAENLWVKRRDAYDTTRFFRRGTAPKPT